MIPHNSSSVQSTVELCDNAGISGWHMLWCYKGTILGYISHGKGDVKQYTSSEMGYT